jgi:hypothetical protein
MTLLHCGEGFLQHGADVNIPNRQNRNTPLVYAMCDGFLDIVRTLLAQGARIDLVGRSSLFVGSSWRTRILTALILEYARDKPSVVTTFGSGQRSSEDSVWGSAEDNPAAHNSSKSYRKRYRSEERDDWEDPNDSDDARGNKRYGRTKRQLHHPTNGSGRALSKKHFGLIMNAEGAKMSLGSSRP